MRASQASPTGPARPPSSDGRTALLEAGVRMVARTGTRGLRVEDVAREAGVSTSLIYHHFGDRASFVRETLEFVSTWVTVLYRRAGTGTGREDLLAALVGEIDDDDRIRTHSAAWGELRGSAVFDEGLRPVIARLTREWVDDIAALVERGRADGSLPATLDPDLTAQHLCALVEGYSGRWLSGQIRTGEARRLLSAAAAVVLGATS